MAHDNAGGTRARRTRRPKTQISWATAPVQTLRAFIGVLTDNGAAVLFGRTMDGGALMVQVLNGKDRYKDYITDHGDIVPVLADIVEEVIDVGLADMVEESDK